MFLRTLTTSQKIKWKMQMLVEIVRFYLSSLSETPFDSRSLLPVAKSWVSFIIHKKVSVSLSAYPYGSKINEKNHDTIRNARSDEIIHPGFRSSLFFQRYPFWIIVQLKKLCSTVEKSSINIVYRIERRTSEGEMEDTIRNGEIRHDTK